ncbi:hypothetical protein ES319_A11G015000v1 [Gossypium barbadense]|uniref:Vesicle transport protein n=2 Tax=Gossypium TaxID=3633 RepID=A0A1U8L146_GOSHI|nr:vesicle transport protein SFT2A-like isoform X2 [Gossypium hirsutum]XP_052877941.1 uncharacterized protein LOC108454648 isoform X3 [Gossypium arboreum]KAB2055131.1 hypothetical protein ES319_A11G015000v1 [Gossypium barbadense]
MKILKAYAHSLLRREYTHPPLVYFRVLFLCFCHLLCLPYQSNSHYCSPLAMSWQSEAFLMGPEQQLRMMFDSVRVYATVIYIGFVILALICALWIQSKILTLLAIICEICALIWYCLSYIPFARRIVSDLMVRFCDTEL